MTPFVLSLKSLRNRRFAVGLTVLSIALSVALLLGVERIRKEARSSFTSTISGTDLLVGPRASSVQLLLSSVFHIGGSANNMTGESWRAIQRMPGVAWTIPVSMGDSHRSHRVVGTTKAYLKHFKYGRKKSLELKEGAWFASNAGAVLGSETARALGYRLGDSLVVAHGSGDVSFIEHDEHPFRVTGILAATGTPVDRSILVDLAGIDAIHSELNMDDEDHDPLSAAIAQAEHDPHHGHDHAHGEACEDHAPDQVTAVFVGLESRSAVLGLQRAINTYTGEALSAVIPAMALQELWEVTGLVEGALLAISVFVVITGLAGMMVALMTSLNERRREMAILRSVGARPVHILGLIAGEAALVSFLGAGVGMLLLYGLLFAVEPLLAARLGLFMERGFPAAREWAWVAGIVVAGSVVGLLPAYRSYRFSVADGLMVKN